ncbi:MAG: H-X9-DG-CTERM domain-containing protein [Phycisphaerales bacterium]
MPHRTQSDRIREARTGFTLVELLLVISIIALLIGLILPALASARKSAQGAACLSQMAQTSVGWGLYANENRGQLVPGQPGRYADESKNRYWVGNGYQYRPRWYAMMGAAAGFYAFAEPSDQIEDEHSTQITNEVFICPSTPKWTSTRNSSYGYNYQFLGNARFRGDDETQGFINYPVRLSRIEAVSTTVMAADSLGTAAGKPDAERTPNQSDGSRHPEGLARGGHGYALDPPRLTGTSDFADTRLSAPEHRSGPDERHNGVANVVFCDGSARSMTATELGYLKNADGSIAFNGATTTNKLFSGTNRDEDPPPVN